MAVAQSLSRSVRLTLLVFIALLTYDGALRKWVFPFAEQLLFVVKDMLLLGCLVMALTHGLGGRVRMYRPAVLWVVAYLLVTVLGVLNPNAPNLAVSLWGLKAHALYVAFCILVPIAFHDLGHFWACVVRLSRWIVLPVCILGLAQLGASADSVLNLQVRGGMDAISYFGQSGLVRISGTFSYITGMAAFIQFAFVLSVAVFLAGCRDRWFLISLFTLAMVLPSTGSRSVVYFALTACALLLLTCRLLGLVSAVFVVRTVLAMGLVATGSLLWQSDVWTALHERAIENREEGQARIFTAFTNAFDYFDAAGFFGFGTGTANFGAVALTDRVPFSWLPLPFEEESGRIVLELGMVGWLVSLLMRLSLVLYCFELLARHHSMPVRFAGAVALPFMLYGLYAGQGVFAASYLACGYWIMVGLMNLAYVSQSSQSELTPQRTPDVQPLNLSVSPQSSGPGHNGVLA